MRHARRRAAVSTYGSDTGPVTGSSASERPDYRDRVEALRGVSLRTCPICHEGQMVAIVVLHNRGRPMTADTS
jgi:hypothetical protein